MNALDEWTVIVSTALCAFFLFLAFFVGSEDE